MALIVGAAIGAYYYGKSSAREDAERDAYNTEVYAYNARVDVINEQRRQYNIATDPENVTLSNSCVNYSRRFLYRDEKSAPLTEADKVDKKKMYKDLKSLAIQLSHWQTSVRNSEFEQTCVIWKQRAAIGNVEAPHVLKLLMRVQIDAYRNEKFNEVGNTYVYTLFRYLRDLVHEYVYGSEITINRARTELRKSINADFTHAYYYGGRGHDKKTVFEYLKREVRLYKHFKKLMLKRCMDQFTKYSKKFLVFKSDKVDPQAICVSELKAAVATPCILDDCCLPSRIWRTRKPFKWCC